MSATIDKLLATANLQAHFKVACELIQTSSDAVPDSLIDRVIDWALLRCTNAEEPEDHVATEVTAWRTVGSLAARASVSTAGKVVTVALSHRSWKAKAEKPSEFIPVREEIIDAVSQSVVVLPVESLDELADAAIPLATERQNFEDFSSAVNLLGHIADRAPDDVKTKIKLALYPPGRPIPPLLIQAAPRFGQEILNKDDQLKKYASDIAENIRRVVQRVPIGEKPEPVRGAVATWNSRKENEQLVVHLISARDIQAMARHRNRVPTESLRIVFSALLEAINNRDNLLDNRIVFINCLKQFADCLDEAIAAVVFDVLAPIAAGNVEVSPDISSATKQSHPLSRMRFSGATAEQVTAHALFVLARIEHCHSGVYGRRLQTMVEKALSSDAPEIRTCAFAAVREIPTLAESTWMPVLLGTRDSDPKAASLAFDAIAAKKDAHLTRAQWRMVVYSLKLAQLSPSIELRKAAAAAVSSLGPQAPIRNMRQELSTIRGLFSRDVAHSVREATKETAT